MGDYVFTSMQDVQRNSQVFMQSMSRFEDECISYLQGKWNKHWSKGITPKADNEFGRTSILPELFMNHLGVQMATWRQKFQTTGHMAVIYGAGGGHTLPEDIALGWVGIALPNKNQHLSEVRWQIGDRKYGRVNLEMVHQYSEPIIIFEEGFFIDEEEAVDIYGYIEPELPDNGPGGEADTVFQRIILLGMAYYRQIDRVLGNTGAAIT